MPFLGTLVNFLAVLVCGIIGTLIKKGVPKRISDAVMSSMAVCVIYIGIDGVMEAAPTLVEGAFLSNGLIKALIMILSMAVGTLLGELINFDKWVNRLGEILEKKFAKDGEQGSFAKGFVSCSLLFCVGAMTVNGAFQDAMGKPDLLLAKAVIDGIVCFMMASTLGIGCAFSSFFVLIYQGALSLLGYFLAGALPATSISYMSMTGSLIIILIGTNVLGCTKVKTANMTPAIFLPALIAPLIALMLG
ncbi:MAG: DUF554 domain-containing protein [Clostridia bacterium]|nr:DUF554 domain-containing protein [Clostridia bacterium]